MASGADGQAGLGQVVVNQSLRSEPAEQAPRYAVFEVQLHGILAESPSVLEGNGPDGGPAPPFAESSRLSVCRRARRVSSAAVQPESLGEHAMVSSRETRSARGVSGSRDFALRVEPRRLPGAPASSQAHRKRLAELLRSNSDVSARTFRVGFAGDRPRRAACPAAGVRPPTPLSTVLLPLAERKGC